MFIIKFDYIYVCYEVFGVIIIGELIFKFKIVLEFFLLFVCELCFLFLELDYVVIFEKNLNIKFKDV